MNEQVQKLHQAYCDTLGIQLVLNPCFISWWANASNMGVTPDDIRLCLEHRIKLNSKREFQFRQGLEIRHLCRNSESIASMLNEAAVLRAAQRKKVFPPGKVEVLKATGRETEPDQGTRNRHISEIFKDIQKQ